MTFERKPQRTAFDIAISGIFAALVFVATYSFIISIPATSGYFNLGETVIYTAALVFGPLVGAACRRHRSHHCRHPTCSPIRAGNAGNKGI